MFSTHNAASADFAEILALQEENHLSNLSEAGRGDGFLTTYLTAERLQELQAERGIVVARSEDGELAGFAGAHAWRLSSESDWHRAVASLFPLQIGSQTITASNSYQYGPVCVANRFRGQGVLALLLSATCANFAAQNDFGITFIDFRNARSLAAHERKLGLQIVADLPFGTTLYRVLGFPTRAFL